MGYAEWFATLTPEAQARATATVQALVNDGMSLAAAQAATMNTKPKTTDETKDPTPLQLAAAEAQRLALNQGLSVADAVKVKNSVKAAFEGLPKGVAESQLASWMSSGAFQGFVDQKIEDNRVASANLAQQQEVAAQNRLDTEFKEDFYRLFLLPMEQKAALALSDDERAEYLGTETLLQLAFPDYQRAYKEFRRATGAGIAAQDELTPDTTLTAFFSAVSPSILSIIRPDLPAANATGQQIATAWQTATIQYVRQKRADEATNADFLSQVKPMLTAIKNAASQSDDTEMYERLSEAAMGLEESMGVWQNQYRTAKALNPILTPTEFFKPTLDARLSVALMGTELDDAYVPGDPRATLGAIVDMPGFLERSKGALMKSGLDPMATGGLGDDAVLRGIFKQAQLQGVSADDLVGQRLLTLQTARDQREQQAKIKGQAQAAGLMPFTDPLGKPTETTGQAAARRERDAQAKALPGGLGPEQAQALAALGMDPNSVIPGGTMGGDMMTFLAQTPAYQKLSPQEQQLALQRAQALQSRIPAQSQGRLDLALPELAGVMDQVGEFRTEQERRAETSGRIAQGLFLPDTLKSAFDPAALKVFQGQLATTYQEKGADAAIAAAGGEAKLGKSGVDAMRANLEEAARNAQPAPVAPPPPPKVETKELKPARPARRV